MDADLQALIVVLVAGSLLFGIGTLALFFVFRAFGGPAPGGASHKWLVGALLLFVFASCAALLFLSYSGR